MASPNASVPRAAARRSTATCISSSGSGLETVQSLPERQRAPARTRLPNGYCHDARSGAEERDRQVVHLRLVRGPQRLDVRGGARAGGTAGCRRGARPGCGRGGGGRRSGRSRQRGLDRVERLPDRAVAERVEVHLEARARPAAVTACFSSSGSTNEMPAFVGRLAVRVEVRRRASPAVKFSTTPSCMIFTLVGANRPTAATRSRVDQSFDLLEPAVRGPTRARRRRAR